MPRKRETTISNELTASQPFSTIRYFNDKRAAVQYAKDLLTSLANVSPLTMTIESEAGSGGFFVSTATAVSSEDIQTLISSKRQQSISDKTLDG